MLGGKKIRSNDRYHPVVKVSQSNSVHWGLCLSESTQTHLGYTCQPKKKCSMSSANQSKVVTGSGYRQMEISGKLFTFFSPTGSMQKPTEITVNLQLLFSRSPV